jgi:hypothetical protein
MATASDLIKGSLRDIGAIAAGETPSASEIADGLESLNLLVSSWSNNGFLIYEEKREPFTLSVGVQRYTIGSGGDFDTSRPMRLKAASIKQSSNDTEIPVRILNIQEWQDIALKSTQSDLVQAIYYNDAYPLAEIDVYPVPSEANSLILYSEKPLTEFALSSTDVILPQGYFRALRKNLAVEMCPEYGKNPNPILMQAAIDSKAEISRVNTKPVYLKSDAAELTSKKSTFNWLTGE